MRGWEHYPPEGCRLQILHIQESVCLDLQVGQDVVAVLQGCIERRKRKMRIAALVMPSFSDLFPSTSLRS